MIVKGVYLTKDIPSKNSLDLRLKIHVIEILYKIVESISKDILSKLYLFTIKRIKLCLLKLIEIL